MDQDVEAILNAPDSDDDDVDGLNVQGVSLEDILREDDDGGSSHDGNADEDDDLLLAGAVGENPPHLGGRSSTSPQQDLGRWRDGRKTGMATDHSPLVYRDSSATAGEGLLSPTSAVGGNGRDRLSGDGGSSTNADGTSSPLSGAPPRTAFLSRDEVSEDSRLLQQILKESEEEIAASAADRANGFGANGFGSGSNGVGVGAMMRVVSSAGGGGDDDDLLYANVDDNLHSLDVDRIIESMEIEGGEDLDISAAAGGGRDFSGSGGISPWRSSVAAVVGSSAATTTTGLSSSKWSSTADATAATCASSATDASLASERRRVREGRGASGETSSSSPPPSGDGSADLATGAVSAGGLEYGSRGGVRGPDSGTLTWRERSRSSKGAGRSAVGGGALFQSAKGGSAKNGTIGGGGGGELGMLTGALRRAEAMELRLLRGGNRDMISPLQVKRRMRAPPPPPPPGQLSTGFHGGSGGSAGGGVGVVRMENLDAASRQLARNAAYGKHGPGICTVTAAHSKFIAIGTSRGLILLFDHFQEIRHVLGSAGGGGAEGAPADDPVTSLDMFVGSDYLVAGHGSGRVLLWDYLRGVILKAVVDVHFSAVVSVRCFTQGGAGGSGAGVGGGLVSGAGLGTGSAGSSDPAVITADVEGVVNKMCFRRVMWTKWVVDTECLLDGAAGPIPALCVLPSWADATASSSFGGGVFRGGIAGGVSPGFHDLGMMAMSSWKNTFIVGIHPEVKVIHKWPRPPIFSGRGETSAAVDHLPPPCLSWGPSQPSAARVQAPPMALLARGWGNSIQILAATRLDKGGESGGGGSRGTGRGSGGGTKWPSLAVMKELSASAPVVAVEWLREQVLAYLDADMELCVLDTRAGTELEHASLSTLGVSISPILPPPPSSQVQFPPAVGGGGGGGADRVSAVAPSSTSSPAPAPPPLGTYHNAFRACEGRLYLLGRQELRAVRVQGWSQRVGSLVQAGEWLEALAVALDHFEQKMLPAENAAAAAVEAGEATLGGFGASFSAHGRNDDGSGSTSNIGGFDRLRQSGGRSADFRGGGVVGGAGAGAGDLRRQAPRSEAAEHINDLLSQYLRLAINNAPTAEPSVSTLAAVTQGGGGMGSAAEGNVSSGAGGGGGGVSRINLAHSHFQMLAGVCVEFCAVTGRLDMLFGQVFHAFRARGQQGVFLDTLEPYVLMGKVKMLSPEVMAAFVDSCQSGGDMIAAERVVLRLEPRSLDIGSTLPLLRRHRLHSALLAVRASRGDYTSSVEEVLQEVMSIAEKDQPRPAFPSGSHGYGEQEEKDLLPYPADPSFDELGYKVLLYLKRCFRGRVLGATEPLSEPDTAKARASLLHLLVRSSLAQAPASPSSTRGVGGGGTGNLEFPPTSSSLSSNIPNARQQRHQGQQLGPSPAGVGQGAELSRFPRWHEALFPYLSVLLYVDAAATIDVLSVAMDSPDAVFRRESVAAAKPRAGGGETASVLPSTAALVFHRSTSSSSTAAISGAGASGGGTGGGGRGGSKARGTGEALGGGVWGRRIGRKGRSVRAIGWSSGGKAAEAGTGPGAPPRSTIEDGDGSGQVVGGWGLAEGTAEAVEAENVCPSRRSIIEAVAAVLAPYLTDQGDHLDAATAAGGLRSPGDNAVGGADGGTPGVEEDHDHKRGGGEERGGGLSAAAFVHGGRPECPQGTGVSAMTESSDGRGDGGGEDVGTVTSSSAAAAADMSPSSPSSLLRDRDGQEWWAAARPHLFDFVAKYLELSLVSVGRRLTNAVLVNAAIGAGGSSGRGEARGESANDAQGRLVTLLERVPLALVDREKLLPLAEQSRFFRAAVILLKAAVTLGEQRGFTLEEFARIVRCYLQDSEENFRSQVFAFIREEIARATVATTAATAQASSSSSPTTEKQPTRESNKHRVPFEDEGFPTTTAARGGDESGDEGVGGNEEELSAKRSVVLSKLPQLMELNKTEAVFTVEEAFQGDHKAALAALATTTTLQFEYLDALIRPNWQQPQAGGRGVGLRAVDGVRSSPTPSRPSSSALSVGLDEGDRALHVRLLVRFRPYEVYPFLSSSTGYSLDDTLALCQERGVADATAYLLERKGDVTSALALALRTLSSRLASLRTALQATNLRELATEMELSLASSSSPSEGGAGTAGSSGPAPSPLSSKKRGFGDGGGGGMGPRAGTAAWARWASKVALEGLQEGRETTRSLVVAIEMCQRASPNSAGAPTSLLKTGGARNHRQAAAGASGAEGRADRSSITDKYDDENDDLDLSASLWFQTLDKILSAKGTTSSSVATEGARGARVGGIAETASASSGGRRATVATATIPTRELPQTAAVMGGVLDALLQRTLSSMAGFVPLPAIVRKVVSDHAGSSLGEFRHVILAMLDTYCYDTAIHKTAASLLFDSLRTVAQERHNLKGKGVRVSTVAGVHLHPARSLGGNSGRGRDTSASSGVPDASATSGAVSTSAEAGLLVANRGGSTPPSPLMPAGMIDALGSGVIHVSPSGIAVVEHLGRGGTGGGEGERGQGGNSESGNGNVRGAAAASTTVAASQQDTSVSLWRLRAARRRRQARGNKMRALVSWSAGERGSGGGISTNASWNSSADAVEQGSSGRGRGGGVLFSAPGSNRKVLMGRGGAEVGGESNRSPPQQAEGEQGSGGGSGTRQQGLGWGSTLQARARAIPSSFLPNRT